MRLWPAANFSPMVRCATPGRMGVAAPASTVLDRNAEQDWGLSWGLSRGRGRQERIRSC
jgi:hypothetical protein